MAEEVEMTPVEMTPVAEEPPKANPLAKPTVPGGTVKLTPVAAAKPGATSPALRPGLKLPPKPGATVTGLKPGLKLPPKPGATVTALKPGLKLPPKPGATATALKPGLKLPPKPVIRKPGESAGPVVPPPPLPKPVVSVDAQGVGKLPTVEAKAIPRAEVAANPAAPAEAAKPMETLKTVTQKLKGITQAIPQQAILRKTGIIADGAVTEAQKEAAKHKTARISLSDAMGVAPVKDEHAPMKTIRIKRPVNIPGSTASLTPQPPKPPVAPAAAPADSAEPAAPASAAAPKASEPATTTTQRKTLKIARPGATVRPAGKFGVRRPSSAVTAPSAAPAGAAEGGATGDAPVADIPDIPSTLPPIPTPVAAGDTTPGWVYTLSSLIQAAAVVMMGALAYFLYENVNTLYF